MININLADVSDLKEVEPCYLLGTIHIMDVPHHVALFEVINDHGTQRTPLEASTYIDGMIDDLMTFDGASKPYLTVEWRDKTYICAITPFMT